MQINISQYFNEAASSYRSASTHGLFSEPENEAEQSTGGCHLRIYLCILAAHQLMTSPACLVRVPLPLALLWPSGIFFFPKWHCLCAKAIPPLLQPQLESREEGKSARPLCGINLSEGCGDVLLHTESCDHGKGISITSQPSHLPNRGALRENETEQWEMPSKDTQLTPSKKEAHATADSIRYGTVYRAFVLSTYNQTLVFPLGQQWHLAPRNVSLKMRKFEILLLHSEHFFTDLVPFLRIYVPGKFLSFIQTQQVSPIP